MPQSEGCSPYAIAVSVLIGIFIGREDAPERGQVCKFSVLFESGIQKVMLVVVFDHSKSSNSKSTHDSARGRKALTGRLDSGLPVTLS